MPTSPHPPHWIASPPSSSSRYALAAAYVACPATPKSADEDENATSLAVPPNRRLRWRTPSIFGRSTAEHRTAVTFCISWSSMEPAQWMTSSASGRPSTALHSPTSHSRTSAPRSTREAIRVRSDARGAERPRSTTRRARRSSSKNSPTRSPTPRMPPVTMATSTPAPRDPTRATEGGDNARGVSRRSRRSYTLPASTRASMCSAGKGDGPRVMVRLRTARVGSSLRAVRNKALQPA